MRHLSGGRASGYRERARHREEVNERGFGDDHGGKYEIM